LPIRRRKLLLQFYRCQVVVAQGHMRMRYSRYNFREINLLEQCQCIISALAITKIATPVSRTPSNALLTHHPILSLLPIESSPPLFKSLHLLRIPQQFPLMLRAPRNLPPLLHRRPLEHSLFPLLQHWKTTQLNPRPSTQRHPAPQTDVCDRAFLLDQVRRSFGGEVGFENGVQAADFVLGSYFGVGDVFAGVTHIMVCLTLVGAHACVLEEEPVLLELLVFDPA
jgi:hypothetical protein